MFLSGIRQWSNLILLQGLFNFPHANYFWDCLIFPGDILSYSVEVYWPYIWGPISGFSTCYIDLYVCFAPVPRRFDDHSFVIQLDVRHCDAACFDFLLHHLIDIYGLFRFNSNFKTFFLHLWKMLMVFFLMVFW